MFPEKSLLGTGALILFWSIHIKKIYLYCVFLSHQPRIFWMGNHPVHHSKTVAGSIEKPPKQRKPRRLGWTQFPWVARILEGREGAKNRPESHSNGKQDVTTVWITTQLRYLWNRHIIVPLRSLQLELSAGPIVARSSCARSEGHVTCNLKVTWLVTYNVTCALQ